MNNLLRPRNWEPACGTERSAASANYMAVIPGVLGCRPLRRTVQVRLGFDLGFRISDLGFLSTIDDIKLTVQISPFVLWFPRALSKFSIRIQQSSTRWHNHLHGLATAIHEISGLGSKG
jgi:3-hydroxymyristoyl/3-hydroxydecanoyl-(acyl carrier protein) dehydratase